MKKIHYLYGVIASIALVLVLLISSFEIAAYSDFGWYQKEYEKYNVLSDLEMEMQDVMYVTEEMMDYLHGNRENLEVQTVVNGENREFFNEREKLHMEDVLNLFLGGMKMRTISVIIFCVCLTLIFLTKGSLKKVLPISFLIGTGSFIGITAVVGMIFMSDFNKYFTLFHHIFFDNDLWLLNPKTDLMIRMLPEGFFLDMVVRIGLIFLILLGVLLLLSVFMVKTNKNKKNL